LEWFWEIDQRLLLAIQGCAQRGVVGEDRERHLIEVMFLVHDGVHHFNGIKIKIR
jgi:hypothetical protein